MKLKLTFPVVFIGTNLFFVFLLIFKQSWMVQLSYQQQRLEKELVALEQKRDELNQELCYQQDPSTIKSYAAKKLKMSKVKLSQVKRQHED